MEDRRTAIAILICISIFLVYQELFITPYTQQFQPKQSDVVSAPPQQNGSGQQLQQVQPVANSATIVAQSGQLPSGEPSMAQIAQAGTIRIESKDHISAEISLLGGRFVSFGLKQFKRELGQSDPYEMVTKSEGLPLPGSVHIGAITDAFVEYKIDQSQTKAKEIGGTYFLSDSESLTIYLVGTLPGGAQITKRFELTPKSYVARVDVSVSTPTSDGTPLWFEWVHFDPNAEQHANWDFHGYKYLSQGKVNIVPMTKVVGIMPLGASDWLSYSDKYFMVALMPHGDQPSEVRIARDGSSYRHSIAGTPSGGSFDAYIGPKEIETLKSLGHNLQRNVDLGIFSFLAFPLLTMLRTFHSLLGNWGLAIVLLTLIIKFAFLPLTKKSFSSMSAMQKLQPQIQAIRERLKSDPTKMNQEVMALYKKNQVNPLGGCLPILIQIPVFLGLYNSLLYSIELRHAPFALWVHDLSAPEQLHLFGMSIPVMVILMGICMFIQQWTTPSTMDPMQKKIMMFMPIFMTFLFLGFPAGLVLYWLTNNVISIIQQWYIRSHNMLHATKATVIASVTIFLFAYGLTLIP